MRNGERVRTTGDLVCVTIRCGAAIAVGFCGTLPGAFKPLGGAIPVTGFRMPLGLGIAPVLDVEATGATPMDSP